MMNDLDARKLKIFLKGCFPQLLERLPQDPFYLKYGHDEFFATHDIEIPRNWLNWTGFMKFIDNPGFPDRYFACGISSHAVSEYLIVLGKNEDRYLWMYDRYVIYVVKDDLSSIPRTQENLIKALKLWDEGQELVLFSAGQFVDREGRKL
jgi:hypothetical protein